MIQQRIYVAQEDFVMEGRIKMKDEAGKMEVAREFCFLDAQEPVLG